MCQICSNPICNVIMLGVYAITVVILQLVLGIWAFVMYGTIPGQIDMPTVDDRCPVEIMYQFNLVIGILSMIIPIFFIISTVLMAIAGWMRDAESVDERRKSWYHNNSGGFNPTTVKVLEGISSIMAGILFFVYLVVVGFSITEFFGMMRCDYIGEPDVADFFRYFAWAAIILSGLVAIGIFLACGLCCTIFLCCGKGSCGKTMKHKWMEGRDV